MEERPATVKGNGLVPCPLPGPEVEKYAEVLSRSQKVKISFSSKKQLPGVLAFSRITRRVCGNVDPRLSALP